MKISDLVKCRAVDLETAEKACKDCRAYSDRRLCGVEKGNICLEIASAIVDKANELGRVG